jgi:hypothetical protein
VRFFLVFVLVCMHRSKRENTCRQSPKNPPRMYEMQIFRYVLTYTHIFTPLQEAYIGIWKKLVGFSHGIRRVLIFPKFLSLWRSLSLLATTSSSRAGIEKHYLAYYAAHFSANPPLSPSSGLWLEVAASLSEAKRLAHRANYQERVQRRRRWMSGLHHPCMERGALMPGHHIEASYWRIRQFGRWQFKRVSWFLRVSGKKHRLDPLELRNQ